MERVGVRGAHGVLRRWSIALVDLHGGSEAGGYSSESSWARSESPWARRPARIVRSARTTSSTEPATSSATYAREVVGSGLITHAAFAGAALASQGQRSLQLQPCLSWEPQRS